MYHLNSKLSCVDHHLEGDEAIKCSDVEHVSKFKPKSA